MQEYQDIDDKTGLIKIMGELCEAYDEAFSEQLDLYSTETYDLLCELEDALCFREYYNREYKNWRKKRDNRILEEFFEWLDRNPDGTVYKFAKVVTHKEKADCNGNYNTDYGYSPETVYSIIHKRLCESFTERLFMSGGTLW